MKNGNYELIVAPPEYPGKKYRGRYCYKHSYVWWKNTGELLKPGEVIHHKNDNKFDNHYRNLEKHTNSNHAKLHNKIITVPNTKCSYCKKEFRIRPWKLKRKYRFCSKKCVGLFGFNSKIKA